MNDENLKDFEGKHINEPSLSEIIEEIKRESGAAMGEISANTISAQSPQQNNFKRPNPQNSSGNKKLKIAAGIAGGIFIFLFMALTGFLYLYNGIFPGVKTSNCTLSGMTINSAANTIENACGDILNGKLIDLVISDKTYAIQMDTVTKGIDSLKSAQAAYAYGRTGNYFERAGEVLSSMFFGYELPISVNINDKALQSQLDTISNTVISAPVEPSYEIRGNYLVLKTGKTGVDYDKKEVYGILFEKMRQMDFSPLTIAAKLEPQQKPDMDKIAAEVNCDPQNASIDKSEASYGNILPEKNGILMDAAKAKEIVGDASEETYKIPIVVTKPEVTAETLRALLFRDVLAVQTTTLNSSLKDRTTNVRLSAQFVNNTILNPDEEFSFNKVVGPRNYARGFKDAKVFAAGEVVDGVGGGICQTSSTIYMAALRADLKISSRFNHMFAVTYAPLGQDATVAYGSTDFKFVNNTPYPIKIRVLQSGNKVTVTLLGTKTDDKTITFSTEILSKTPFETIEKNDDTLPYGTKKVDQGGYIGYKTVTYKTVTVNGKSTKSKVNTSNYKKLDKIILVGTKGAPAGKTPSHDDSAGSQTAGGTTETSPAVPAANTQLNQANDPEAN